MRRGVRAANGASGPFAALFNEVHELVVWASDFVDYRSFPPSQSLLMVLDVSYFRLPESSWEWKARLARNWQTFRTNYLNFALSLYAYVFIANTLGFLGLILVMLGWFYALRTRNENLPPSTSMSREELYGLLFLGTASLAISSPVVVRVCWATMACASLCFAHATMRASAPAHAILEAAAKRQQAIAAAAAADGDADLDFDGQSEVGSACIVDDPSHIATAADQRASTEATYKRLAQLRRQHSEGDPRRAGSQKSSGIFSWALGKR
eukprot:tig00000863_g4964.t1